MTTWDKVINFFKSKMGHDKHVIIEEVPFEELTLDEYLEISSFDDELE